MRAYIKQWIMGQAVVIAGNILIGLFFELSWVACLFLLVFSSLLVPVGIRVWIGEKGQWQKYYDMTAYMELLLCSFKRLGHIKMALQDCQLVFHEESILGQAVHRAIHILETGEDTGDLPLTQSAFNEISKNYNCRIMQIIHHFLGRVEHMGGDVTETLDLLLTDLEMWKRRFVLYHKKRQFLGRECTVAAVLALLLCGLSRLLIPMDLQENFVKSTVYQVSTIVVYCLVMGSTMWIRYYAGRVQDDLSRERDTAKAMEREFSYWLLAVTLYLNQDSLYQALLHSMTETEGRFRNEVKCLVEAIYQNPTSLQPYLDFFPDLELPEMRTGMKMLYAVNSNGYSDTKKQINFLIEQNNAVMDRCEKEYFRTKIASLRFLRQIPMILAGGKVMIDMVLFLVLLADRLIVFS